MPSGHGLPLLGLPLLFSFHVSKQSWHYSSPDAATGVGAGRATGPRERVRPVLTGGPLERALWARDPHGGLGRHNFTLMGAHNAFGEGGKGRQLNQPCVPLYASHAYPFKWISWGTRMTGIGGPLGGGEGGGKGWLAGRWGGGRSVGPGRPCTPCGHAVSRRVLKADHYPHSPNNKSGPSWKFGTAAMRADAAKHGAADLPGPIYNQVRSCVVGEWWGSGGGVFTSWPVHKWGCATVCVWGERGWVGGGVGLWWGWVVGGASTTRCILVWWGCGGLVNKLVGRCMNGAVRVCVLCVCVGGAGWSVGHTFSK
jgi:hypothetical protein